MRIVADANVLIRAHKRSKALARALLHQIVEQGHRLVLSNEMLSEVVRVLRYPELQNLYGLTDDDLLEYAQFLRSVSDIVIIDPLYRLPLIRDPNDADVLQTAERGSADILCTQDKDFFEDAAVLSFCALRGIDVCTERTLIERLARLK